MKTLVEQVHQNIIPDIIKRCAEKERVPVLALKQRIADGSAVILKSINSPVSDENACAVGTGLRTKVNANIGTSPDKADLAHECEKLRMALDADADALMDLSTGGDLRAIRRAIRASCPKSLGTVPIYQAVCEIARAGKRFEQLDAEHLFAVIEQHADEGVDFITVHCGVTRETVRKLAFSNRKAGVVSRGGSFIVRWMEATGKENPLYEQFDRLLAIARKYDVTVSLGDGLRPGAIADASDMAQCAELNVLGELVIRARAESVQVIVEGPGHMPLNHIAPHMLMEKTVCREAPFYVLGPLVTDVAAGYDHITSAIGGACAAAAGADFLCYVTPSEHIHLPGPADVRTGVIAARIAAHAGDVAKGIPGARERDDAMSEARKELNWEKQRTLALDPKHFKQARETHQPADKEVCTMCGEFCAMKKIQEEVHLV